MPDLEALREAPPPTAPRSGSSPPTAATRPQEDLFERRVDELGASEAGSRVARPGPLGAPARHDDRHHLRGRDRRRPVVGRVARRPVDREPRPRVRLPPQLPDRRVGAHLLRLRALAPALRRARARRRRHRAGHHAPRVPLEPAAGRPPDRASPTTDDHRRRESPAHPSTGVRRRGDRRRRLTPLASVVGRSAISRRRRRGARARRRRRREPAPSTDHDHRARGRVLLDGRRRARRPGRLQASPTRTPQIEGLLTFRGNPSRSYYGVGPGARRRPTMLHRFPDEPMCRESVEPRRDEGVVRDGLDRPAAHRRARGPALGDLRRLRRQHPLHGCAHRRADPPRRGDRRHHQGHPDRRPRRAARSSTPARATTCCGSSPSTGPGEAEVLWTARQRVGGARAVERRLGLLADRARRLPRRRAARAAASG